MKKVPVPAHDPDWLALDMPTRDRVYCWLAALSDLPSGLPICGTGGIIDRLSKAMGCSKGLAKKRYYAWREDPGNWRVMVNGNTLKSRTANTGVHSPRFIAWGKAILDKHQRSEQQGILEIQHRIISGREQVPGFEEWTKGTLPPGCSAANLRKVLARTKAEKQQGKWGSRAAAAVLPYVRTSRVGLPVGGQMMFDDVWHDHYVTFAGKPVRVLEFGAHDVASGCRFDWGHMPFVALPDDPKKRKALDNEMFRLFLANILYSTGYHPDGCLLMMEHGTANLSEKYIAALHDRTGGVIRVGMGGMTGAGNALMGGWAGRGAGNPRYKAMIECLHSLIHNVLGALPGQSGRDRRQPESTDGMVAYQNQLCKTLPRLGEYADMLKSPFLDFYQFSLILRDVYAIINNRTNHMLEGWRECGHMIREYALAEGVWTPENKLPDPTRGQAELQAWQAIRALVLADPSRLRETRLSPSAVWEQGKKQLWRIPLDLYVTLLGQEKVRTLTVKRGYMTLQDKTLSPEPRIYHAYYTDLDDGRRHELADDKHDVVINPFKPASVIVLDKRGGILGAAPLSVAAPRHDEDAVKSQMGLISSRRADLMMDYKVRNTPARASVASIKEHNDAVLRLARQQHDALPDDRDALPGAPSVPGVDVFAAPSLPDREDEPEPEAGAEYHISLEDMIPG